MKKSVKPDREPISVPEPFQSSWNDWIQYKKDEKNHRYKKAETEAKAFEHLLELSFHDPEIARKIVDQSISNLWAGLFPLKTYSNGFNLNGGRIKSDTEKWAELAASAARIQYS